MCTTPSTYFKIPTRHAAAFNDDKNMEIFSGSKGSRTREFRQSYTQSGDIKSFRFRCIQNRDKNEKFLSLKANCDNKSFWRINRSSPRTFIPKQLCTPLPLPLSIFGHAWRKSENHKLFSWAKLILCEKFCGESLGESEWVHYHEMFSQTVFRGFRNYANYDNFESEKKLMQLKF